MVGGEGKIGSLGLVDAITLEWINNKVLLYSTGNNIQYILWLTRIERIWKRIYIYVQLSHFALQKKFSSVQSLTHVQLFTTPWTTARQASLSITNSQTLLKLMSIESVMPSNHLILCRPLLLLPSILPNIRVFSNESVLHIRWPKYWSFSFSIRPSNECSGLISFRISFRIDWISLQSAEINTPL